MGRCDNSGCLLERSFRLFRLYVNQLVIVSYFSSRVLQISMCKYFLVIIYSQPIDHIEGVLSCSGVRSSDTRDATTGLATGGFLSSRAPWACACRFR